MTRTARTFTVIWLIAAALIPAKDGEAGQTGAVARRDDADYTAEYPWAGVSSRRTSCGHRPVRPARHK